MKKVMKKSTSIFLSLVMISTTTAFSFSASTNKIKLQEIDEGSETL